MDYTTIANVKAALGSHLSTDDATLNRLITAASRAVDRKCTGVPDAVDYFKLETITGEKLRAQIESSGQSIICYPHKPIVTSCTAFAFQGNITLPAVTVDPSRIECDGPRVTAYPLTGQYDFPSRVRVTLSYVGGLAASGSTLPDDLQDLVTILAVRYYREEETGLTDAIGVAELATMVYTKAWPVRVIEGLQPYMRRVGWRWTS